MPPVTPAQTQELVRAELAALPRGRRGQAVAELAQRTGQSRATIYRQLAQVANDRVWRYLVVDHYSGAIFCFYVMGAESGANLVESFIRAVTPRAVGGQADPFCGVPLMVYMDPGSANTGALFKNLARRIGVTLLVHAPGNGRAADRTARAAQPAAQPEPRGARGDAAVRAGGAGPAGQRPGGLHRPQIPAL